MRPLEKLFLFVDSKEERQLVADAKPVEAMLKDDFRREIAVQNRRKALRFWLWVSLAVEAFRCGFSAYAVSKVTVPIPLASKIFIALYWVVFGLNIICLIGGAALYRNPEKHWRFIQFACNVYMLIYMLRGVVFAVLDLESGIIGFSMIVALFISCYTLYYRPSVLFWNTVIALTAFFTAVVVLRLNAFLEPLVIFRILVIAVLSVFTGIARYRSKYMAFLKERSLLEKGKQLRSLNAQLQENREKIEAQNHLLRQMSTTDNLTGVGNRRSFRIQIKAAFARAAESKQFVTLAIADIDNFKTINDGYGHSVGDECLRAIGKALQGVEEENIHAYRFGGDEFVLVFEGKSRSEAFLVMNRLVKDISNLQVDGYDKILTVSIGIYSEIPTTESTADEYIEKADRAMYEAKESGKNRIITSYQEGE